MDGRLRLGKLRGHERSPGRDVNRVGDVQPNVPVDASALVPPTLEVARVHVDCQHVSASAVGVGRDVIAKARVAAGVTAQVVAVKPDLAVPVNAVEVHPERLAPVRQRQRERQAVPGGGGGQETMARVGLGAERALDNEIVRQMDGAPAAVVVGRRRRA